LQVQSVLGGVGGNVVVVEVVVVVATTVVVVVAAAQRPLKAARRATTTTLRMTVRSAIATTMPADRNDGRGAAAPSLSQRCRVV
jgi:hypothetical protein